MATTSDNVCTHTMTMTDEQSLKVEDDARPAGCRGGGRPTHAVWLQVTSTAVSH